MSCIFDLTSPLPANPSPSGRISKSKSCEQFPADPIGDEGKELTQNVPVSQEKVHL